MNYVILPRRYSLLIYDKHPTNYVASCQINVNGKKATLDTLNGEDFYRFIGERGLEPFKELGIDEVGCAVTLPHLKLIKRVLSKCNLIDLEVVGEPYKMGPAEVVWIRLTEKKPESS